jgi:sulfatase maturation enzyme AslB (radical SAM superfamily)
MDLEEYRKNIRKCFHTQDLEEMEPIVNHFDSLPPVEKIQFWNVISTLDEDDLLDEIEEIPAMKAEFIKFLSNIFSYRVAIACKTPEGKEHLNKQTLEYAQKHGIQLGT